jgi:uncharacterized membrane protein
VVLGVAAAALRFVYHADLGMRMEPVRQRVLRAIGLADTDPARRQAEVAEFDRRYRENPSMTVLHVVPGAVYLAFGLLQFSATLRRRHPAVHRWSGRVLLATMLATSISAFYFAFLMPFGGAAETAAIALFGGIFVVASIRGWMAIRRRDAARHREWMIRAFAVAVAISVIRVIGAVLDIVLTPRGVAGRDMFVLSLWTGWIVTVIAAEGWIRLTRQAREVSLLAARATT